MEIALDFTSVHIYVPPLKLACMITIQNNDRVVRTITNAGIVAVTKKGDRKTPEGFMTIITPGGKYQGDVCFGDDLDSITKLECKF